MTRHEFAPGWTYLICKTCGSKRKRLKDGECIDCYLEPTSD